MTHVTRRRILQYGIAIDLVILATGIGMLLPVSPLVLVIAYAAAVALSVWKGGWQGGLTALVLSIVTIVLVFPALAHARFLLPFAGTSVLLGAVVALVMRDAPRTELEEVAPPPIDFRVEAERVAREREEADRLAREESERAAREEAERAPREAEREPRDKTKRAAREPKRDGRKRAAEEARKREQAEREARERAAEEARQREEAERVAREREEAERAAEETRKREEAERVAREREEAERAAEEARQREEAERVAREREEAERAAEEARQREEAERVAREREEAERAAEEARQREEAERVAREREEAERIAEETRKREEAERVAREREEAEREARERAAEEARKREEAERVAREREEAEREARERAAEEARKREEAERVAREREEAEREAREHAAQLERELAARMANEEELRRSIEAEREAMRAETERQVAAARKAAEEEAARNARVTPKPAKVAASPKPSLFGTISGWFRRDPAPRNTANLVTKRVNGNTTANRKAAASRASHTTTRRTAAAAPPRKPHLLMLERRRGTADTIAPRLRQRGTEVVVVERWVDAVDEIFRFKPDAILLDAEHPEFDRIHRTIVETSTNLPIVVTGRTSHAAPSHVRYAAFLARPYDVDELVRLSQKAMSHPEDLLAEQSIPRTKLVPRASTPAPAPVQRHEPRPSPPPLVPVASLSANDLYEVACFNCRVKFDAVEADWCSCLTKERTLVCTNCLTCFCKAPASYKEKFWVEAPPRLFERKTSEARRQQAALPTNPASDHVRRPLVLCVEDDEEIQAIVQRVCTNLDYGFIFATNGQDGLELARQYQPNLILSDAFMPKLDGREMCRQLKEEAPNADWKMVVMTGLYTDTKYRSEALKRFRVDDYIAKPVAITDLISLLQRNLEGLPVADPQEEDLAQNMAGEMDDMQLHDDDVPLAEVIDMPLRAAEPKAAAAPDTYPVACVNCRETFDATRAEWCRCVGRDNTLVCDHCGECFCKAPAAYKERFWVDAPSSLFERKMIGSKRNLVARSNPTPFEVKRPLILLVEDDENVQLIVRTVVTSMGYGFVVGANGQEGLQLAREYNPDLILSDAFMPKLDGREMCRLLKEDPKTSRAKAIIMTGLYTDRKYRNEALDYFKVDDYVAKPLAVEDLIKLFKKHLPQELSATM